MSEKTEMFLMIVVVVITIASYGWVLQSNEKWSGEFTKYAIGGIALAVFLIAYFSFGVNEVPPGEYKLDVILEVTEWSEVDTKTTKENAVATIERSYGEFYLTAIMLSDGSYLPEKYIQSWLSDTSGSLDETDEMHEIEIFYGDNAKIETVLPPLTKDTLGISFSDLIKQYWLHILILIACIFAMLNNLVKYNNHKLAESQKNNGNSTQIN